MKTDENSKKIIVAVIVMILLALTLYIVESKSSNANAAEVSIPQVEQKRNVSYEELIHAYNMVLHRVLIDNPSYFEDVLTESEEYCRLNCLLFPEDKDEIYNLSISDSLEYENNRTSEMADPQLFKSSYE
jgi:hypothetical protein